MATKKPVKGGSRPAKGGSRRKPPGRTAGDVRPSIDRRDAFVAAYMGEAKMNGTLAATMAGYSSGRAAVTASELLNEPAVVAKIDALKAEVAKQSEVTAVTLTSMLLGIARGETLATVGVSEGVPILGEPNHASRIKAIEVVAKLNGLMTERIEANVATVDATADRIQAWADKAREAERLEAQLRERGSE